MSMRWFLTVIFIWFWFWFVSNWERQWHPTPELLPGKCHGQRRLVGCSPRGHKRVGHDRVTRQQQWFQWVFQRMAALSWAACFCKQACLIHSAFSSQQIRVEVPSWCPQAIVQYWGILWSPWCGSLRFNCSHCSFAKSCPTLCNPMDCSMQGFLSSTISQSLLKLMSIQPSHPLCPLLLLTSIFPSLRVFSYESALCIMWPKYWSFSVSTSNEYSEFISFRIDWFDLLAAQGTLKSLRILSCSTTDM